MVSRKTFIHRMATISMLSLYGLTLIASIAAQEITFEDGRKLTMEEKEERSKAMISQDRFAGKRYRYRIHCTPHNGSSPPPNLFGPRPQLLIDAERELVIGNAYSPSKVLPTTLTLFIKNPGIPIYDSERIAINWYAYNGQESRVWENNLFDKFSSGSAHGGRINTHGGEYLLSKDPFLKQLAGVSKYRTTSQAASKQSLAWPLEKFDSREIELPPFGRCIESRIVDIGENGEEVHFRNITTNGPEYLILYGGSDGQEQGSISELMTVNGVRFPKKGRDRDVYSWWEFELLEVEEFETPLRPADWFPPWPRGTDVSDIIHGKITRIPFSSEERNSLYGYVFTTQKLGLPAIGWSPWMWLNSFLLASLVVLIGYKVYKNIRAT